MAFSQEQLRVARGLASAPLYERAGPKVRKALAEAGIVESGLSNPSGGDRDSIGALQQRPSQGWGSPQQLASPQYQAEQFLRRAIPLAGKYGSAGQLAQAVQRSAFPGRYDEHSAEAAQLLAQLGGSNQGHNALRSMGVEPQAQSPDIAALLQSIAAPQSPSVAGTPLARPETSGGPEQAATGPRTPSPLTPTSAPTSNALTAAIQALSEQQPTEQAASAQKTAPPAGAPPKGLVDFGGKRVAAWIAPALQYAKAHGWKGSVTSGYRSKVEQERIYNSGVRPAAVPGTSNHEGDEYPRGAVDVSESEQLSKILERSPYKGKLVWAGGKDPPHFSHPVNGRY